MSETSEPAVYAALVAELGDPETVAREVDEFLIRWHVAHLDRAP